VQDTGEKKDRIVFAALDIFGRRPYEQVKIEEIAEQAGVGKGTIYEYFASKEELFATILEAGFQDYFQELSEAAAEPGPAAARLRAVFARHLAFISQHAAAARIIIGERPATRPELQEAMLGRYVTLSGLIETILREGVSGGEFRPLDTTVAAQAIVGMFSALLVVVLFAGQSREEAETGTEKLVDFCLYGLMK